MLGVYKEFAENVLAMPVHGRAEERSEKFAGASKTYSIEALMGDGRALQAGTSHNLGQNFAKAFEIQFQGRDKTLQHAWTTSWGVSTRLIGGVIMTHGDDSGLILPPQDRAVPGGDRADSARQLAGDRAAQGQGRAGRPAVAGVRVFLDAREEYTPGWKFAEWEMRGVPLRLEIGPKDIEKGQVVLARRDTREKMPTPLDGPAAEGDRRCSTRSSRRCWPGPRSSARSTRRRAATWDEFTAVMEGRPGFVVAKLVRTRRVRGRRSRPRRRPRSATCRSSRCLAATCVHCGQAGDDRRAIREAY